MASQNVAGPGGQQREQDRLGGVGDRREVVAREDGERLHAWISRSAGLLGIGQRTPECDATKPRSRRSERRGGLDGGRPSDDDAGAGRAEVWRARPVDPAPSIGRSSAGPCRGRIDDLVRIGRAECQASSWSPALIDRRKATPAAWARARAIGASPSRPLGAAPARRTRVAHPRRPWRSRRRPREVRVDRIARVGSTIDPAVSIPPR